MGLLAKAHTQASLPAVDLERAKKFYTDKLGLSVEDIPGGGAAIVKAGDAEIFLYPRETTKADHTVVNFLVDDVEAVVKELEDNDVEFEKYDLPDTRYEGNISIMGDDGPKGTWIKDSEGNILGIFEM